MDRIFEPYVKELITGRTEELAWAAEKLPEFKRRWNNSRICEKNLLRLSVRKKQVNSSPLPVAWMCLFTNTAIAPGWRTAFG